MATARICSAPIGALDNVSRGSVFTAGHPLQLERGIFRNCSALEKADQSITARRAGRRALGGLERQPDNESVPFVERITVAGMARGAAGGRDGP